MPLAWIYKLGGRLPGPARSLLRPLVNRYFELRAFPLAGALAGCFMRGEVPSSYRQGNYESEVCQVLMRIVQPGWVCVDVGAHVGYFTLLLAKLVHQSGRVVAFEAHPGNTGQLSVNVRINGFEDRVQVENVAVSSGNTHCLKLFPGRGHGSAEWNVVGHDVEGNPTEPELEVRATSLDAYFPPGSRLDFVKIDIEGAEAEAICGMNRLLEESRPLVVVEFHDEIGWAGREELFATGYCLYDILNARWLDSELDVQRVYHCLAVPRERSTELGI